MTLLEALTIGVLSYLMKTAVMNKSKMMQARIKPKIVMLIGLRQLSVVGGIVSQSDLLVVGLNPRGHLKHVDVVPLETKPDPHCKHT